MAVANSTPVKAVKGRAVKPRRGIDGPLPVFGMGDGVLTFRHGLCVRDREVIDQALDIVGRALRQPSKSFESPGEMQQYLILAMAAEPHERFAVMYLDARNCALAFETHFVGTLNHAVVYPREIVLAALKHGASSVVLCHNHPSGCAHPSQADEMMTQTLLAALRLVDVRVLDHIVVAGNSGFSFALGGLL